jgi:hypothetical protein
MEIRGECSHGGNLFRSSADESGHLSCGLLCQKLPLRQRRVLQVSEMANDSNGRPSIEMCL